jgi:ribosomal protein S18 acetylase RimI-like enzyme
MISVRTARPGDGVALVETTRALAHFHGYHDGFKAIAEDYERALFCDQPIIGALIAEEGDSVAGSVIWHRSFSTNAGREIMYLEDISVLPAFQRKGVGKTLMRATAQVAIARGYDAIFWLVMPWNEVAKQMYVACGAEMEADHTVCRVKGDALKVLAQ